MHSDFRYVGEGYLQSGKSHSVISHMRVQTL